MDLYQPPQYYKCGHVFCNSCLRTWYHHTIRASVEISPPVETASPTYNAIESTPPNFEAHAINDEENRSYHATDRDSQSENEFESESEYESDAPALGCPLCRAKIETPPVPADKLREVAAAVFAFHRIFEPFDERECRLSSTFHRTIDESILVSTQKLSRAFDRAKQAADFAAAYVPTTDEGTDVQHLDIYRLRAKRDRIGTLTCVWRSSNKASNEIINAFRSLKACTESYARMVLEERAELEILTEVAVRNQKCSDIYMC
ncbi:hypothetical protein CVT26_014073 [Gymnopilus dilepis]|uniref:Zinc finger C3HC4 RING-type domain-containing protein n=1 Tax=Gymnopilus dilepis TaxID=231916 RepID=A0A409VX90_9AGAR|nr:hypothetical protein CVT26_014073 [Gymnopilus dilepis]